MDNDSKANRLCLSLSPHLICICNDFVQAAVCQSYFITGLLYQALVQWGRCTDHNRKELKSCFSPLFPLLCSPLSTAMSECCSILTGALLSFSSYFLSFASWTDLPAFSRLWDGQFQWMQAQLRGSVWWWQVWHVESLILINPTEAQRHRS